MKLLKYTVQCIGILPGNKKKTYNREKRINEVLLYRNAKTKMKHVTSLVNKTKKVNVLQPKNKNKLRMAAKTNFLFVDGLIIIIVNQGPYSWALLLCNKSTQLYGL